MRDLPIVLVLYDGKGKYRDEYDDKTQRLFTDVFRRQPIAAALRSYVIVSLPLRELAALSNLANIPAYELATRSSPNLILAQPDARQVAALPGSVQPEELAMHLWKPVHESYLLRADRYASVGKISDALRLLRRIQCSRAEPETQQRARQRIDELTLDLAGSWAERGKTADALRH